MYGNKSFSPICEQFIYIAITLPLVMFYTILIVHKDFVELTRVEELVIQVALVGCMTYIIATLRTILYLYRHINEVIDTTMITLYKYCTIIFVMIVYYGIINFF